MISNTQKNINNDLVVVDESSDIDLDDLETGSVVSLSMTDSMDDTVSVAKTVKTAVCVRSEQGEESSDVSQPGKASTVAKSRRTTMTVKSVKKSKKSKKSKKVKAMSVSTKSVTSSSEYYQESSEGDVESQESEEKESQTLVQKIMSNWKIAVFVVVFLAALGFVAYTQLATEKKTTRTAYTGSESDSGESNSEEPATKSSDSSEETWAHDSEEPAKEEPKKEDKKEEKKDDKEDKKEEEDKEFELPLAMDVPSHFRRQGGKRTLQDLHHHQSDKVKQGHYGKMLAQTFTRCFPDFFLEMSGDSKQKATVMKAMNKFHPQAYKFRYEDGKAFKLYMSLCHDWRRSELFGLNAEKTLPSQKKIDGMSSTQKAALRKEWMAKKDEANKEKLFKQWNEGLDSESYMGYEQQREQQKHGIRMQLAQKRQPISDAQLEKILDDRMGPKPRKGLTIEEFNKEFEGKDSTSGYFHFLFSHLKQFDFIKYQCVAKESYLRNTQPTSHFQLLAVFCAETDAPDNLSNLHSKLSDYKQGGLKAIENWTSKYNEQKELVATLLTKMSALNMSSKYEMFSQQLKALLTTLDQLFKNEKVATLMTLLEAEERDWDAIWAAMDAYRLEMEKENHEMVENSHWRNFSGAIIDLINNNAGEDDEAIRTPCQNAIADCCCCAGNIGKSLGCWSIKNGKRDKSIFGRIVWAFFLLSLIFLLCCFSFGTDMGSSNFCTSFIPKDASIFAWGAEETGSNFIGEAYGDAMGANNGTGCAGGATCPLMTIGLSVGGATGMALGMFVLLHILAQLYKVPQEMCGCCPCCQGQQQH